MTWQQANWPLALLIYLGLLAMFAVIVYCTYLPIRFMASPLVRRLPTLPPGCALHGNPAHRKYGHQSRK